MPRPTKSERRTRSHPEHALFEAFEGRQLMAAISWDGGGDGTTLAQATNWAGDVLPGAADDAVINVAGTPSLLFNSGAFSVHSLNCSENLTVGGGTMTLAAASSFSGAFTLSGGNLTGAGDLTIGGAFSWSGGEMSGTGTTTLAASSTSTLGGVSALGFNRNITNAGTVNWNGGQLGGYTGPAVTFTNNGTFNANPASNSVLSANSAPNTFVNHGAFTKLGSAQASFDGFALSSTAPVTVSAGTLRLAAGGSMSAALSLAAGTTLTHGGGTFTYSSGATCSGSGTWNFSGGTTNFDIGFAPAGSVTISYGTLNLNANSTIASLTQSGGSVAGSGNTTITSVWNFTGGGVAGPGPLTIAASATVNLTGGSFGINRDVTNAGTVNVIGSTLGGQTGPGITFTNNGTVNAAISTDNLFYGNSTPSTLINNGTFNKTGVHTLTFSNIGLVNNGTLSVTGGELSLGSGGGLGGTINLSAGTFLDTGGAFSDHTGTISGAGTLRFQNGSHALAGTLTDGVQTSIDNATFTGAGNLAFNALTDWNSGTMSGTGTTTIGSGVILTMSTFATKTLSRTLINNGKIQHSAGYLQFAGNATLLNSPGKVYNLTGTADLYCVGTNNTINNAGVLNVQTSQNSEFHGVFNNSGSLNVYTGVFHIDGGGTNTGARNIAAGAIITYRADYTHAAGSTSSGSGTLVFNGGTQTISGDWTSFSYAQLLQGTLTGPGNLTTNGPLNWAGGSIIGTGNLTIGTGGKLDLVTIGNHILGRNIVNKGQLDLLNGTLHLSGTTISNQATGTFAVLSATTVSVSGGVNVVNNAGTFRKMSATTTAFDSSLGGVTFNNIGMVDVRNGTLSLNGPVTQIAGTTLSAGSWQVYPSAALGLGSAAIHTIASGATVTLLGSNAGFAALSSLTTNNGTLNLRLGGVNQFNPAGGTFTNNGTINMDADRWLQIGGSFVQGSTGAVNLSLYSASRYSRVIASGSESLGGAVSFNFVNGYVPTSGTVFDFFQSASRSGTFATSTIPAIPGHTAHIVYLPTGAKLMIS